MTAGLVKEPKLEKNVEKQTGCMSGFLQIFDRHQILSGKRQYSAKRLPPSLVSLSNLIFSLIYSCFRFCSFLTKKGNVGVDFFFPSFKFISELSSSKF